MKKTEHFKKKSDLARALFIEASIKYSASVVSQGLFIALQAQDRALSARDINSLANELTSSPDDINAIAMHANSFHQKNSIQIPVSDALVKGIIAHDFEKAAQYLGFNKTQIEFLLNVSRQLFDFLNHESEINLQTAEKILREIKRIFPRIATPRTEYGYNLEDIRLKMYDCNIYEAVKGIYSPLEVKNRIEHNLQALVQILLTQHTFEQRHLDSHSLRNKMRKLLRIES